MEVTQMAAMVPTGMEACGSARSPDRLEPAIIPRMKGKKAFKKKLSKNFAAGRN